MTEHQIREALRLVVYTSTAALAGAKAIAGQLSPQLALLDLRDFIEQLERGEATPQRDRLLPLLRAYSDLAWAHLRYDEQLRRDALLQPEVTDDRTADRA